MRIIRRFDGDCIIVECWKDGCCVSQFRFRREELEAIVMAFSGGVRL